MKPKWKKKAAFYARLAALPPLDELPPWELQRLVHDAQQLGPPWLTNTQQVDKLIKKSAQKRGSRELTPEERSQNRLDAALYILTRDTLTHVQKWAKRWILEPLTSGQLTQLPALPANIPYELTDHALRPRLQEPAGEEGSGYPQKAAIHDLFWLLLQDPYPFALCGQCHAPFVPERAQKYCSPNCSRLAILAGLRHSPRRKEYMREYMQKKRSDAKHTVAA